MCFIFIFNMLDLSVYLSEIVYSYILSNKNF
jgi:hypothetical protein